jgi:predicted Holliday junction resolvase-like endonuclease
MIEILIILSIGLLVLVFLVIYLIYKYRTADVAAELRAKEWLRKEEKRIRQDAIRRSANTIVGKTLEKLIPFTKDFKYDSRDLRWLGDPVDFMVVRGYGQYAATGDVTKITEIVICEVKSGRSRLTKEQKHIEKLVKEGKVRFETARLAGSTQIIKDLVEKEFTEDKVA